MSKIVLCDIDGTIANNDHRQHLLKEYKDWDLFFSKLDLDEPIKEIIKIVNEYAKQGMIIYFVTGRPMRYELKTKDWLKKFFKFKINLIMRNNNDSRNKFLIKEELFSKNFQREDIQVCIENDPELCKLWESFGLNVINVNDLLSN
ncbi:hypothetical protein OAD37_04495 [Gammaproteobacteria bacterium]|nr:hypothetical protein [Gammaproteobacteria bacterium]MDB9901035.1 hypothetical protein [Gammaproteobacteria bacterium]